MMLFTLLSLLLLASGVSGQMPPSDWMAQAQAANCQNVVPAAVLIYNDSRSRFDTFWVNPKTQELKQISIDPVEDKTVAPYNTHVDQIMELHEVPDEETGDCNSKDKTCRRAFVKIHSDVKLDNVYRLTPEFEVIPVENELRARAYLGESIQSDVHIVNDTGGAEFNVYFMRKGGGESLLTGHPVRAGGDAAYQSYVLNEFEIRETGACEKDGSCRETSFQNPGDSPTVKVNEKFECIVDSENISEAP